MTLDPHTHPSSSKSIYGLKKKSGESATTSGGADPDYSDTDSDSMGTVYDDDDEDEDAMDVTYSPGMGGESCVTWQTRRLLR
jgi:hypothetical protein